MSDEPSTPPWTEAPGSTREDSDAPNAWNARNAAAGSDGRDGSDGGAGADDPAPPAERIRSADGLLVLADFDGTLADVQPRPDQARIRPASREALASLADMPRTAVAVVSGRALADVRERVGLDGIGYAGNHGLEIETADRRFVHPGAEEAASTVEAICADLRDRLADVGGTIVEEKNLSATVHYRQVPSEDVERVGEAVRQSVEEHAGSAESGAADPSEDPGGGAFRIEEGKEIFELKPAVDWDKGRAVEWLRDVLVPDGATWHVVYVGDDVTDEDAFRALAGTGTTVRVGEPDGSTAADYLVDGPADVTALFGWLASLRGQDDEP